MNATQAMVTMTTALKTTDVTEGGRLVMCVKVAVSGDTMTSQRRREAASPTATPSLRRTDWTETGVVTKKKTEAEVRRDLVTDVIRAMIVTTLLPTVVDEEGVLLVAAGEAMETTATTLTMTVVVEKDASPIGINNHAAMVGVETVTRQTLMIRILGSVAGRLIDQSGG